jgi:hypothetical protein
MSLGICIKPALLGKSVLWEKSVLLLGKSVLWEKSVLLLGKSMRWEKSVLQGYNSL